MAAVQDSEGQEASLGGAAPAEDRLLLVSEVFPDKYGWHLPVLVNTSVTDALASERGHWSDRLCHFLHQRKVHIALTILLVLDVLLVISGAILEIQILQEELHLCEEEVHQLERTLKLMPVEHAGSPTNSAAAPPSRMLLQQLVARSATNSVIARMETAERTVAWISVSILIIFLVEHALLIIASGFRYFKNLLYVLDLVLIVVSLTLELLFFNNPEGGLVILGRVWRFARIVHGIFETSEREYKKQFHEDIKHFSAGLTEAMEVVCDSYYIHGLDGATDQTQQEARQRTSFRSVARAFRDQPRAVETTAAQINKQQPTLVFQLVTSVGTLYTAMQQHRPHLSLIPKKYLTIASHFGAKHRRQ